MKLSQKSGMGPFKLSESIVAANQGDMQAAKEIMKVMAMHDGELGSLKAGAVALDKKDLFQIRMHKMGKLPDMQDLRNSIKELSRILPPGVATSVDDAGKKCDSRNKQGANSYITSLSYMSKGDPFLDNIKLV